MLTTVNDAARRLRRWPAAIIDRGSARRWWNFGRDEETARSQTKKLMRLDFDPASKYPPAKPGALGCEPLKAASGVADATPISCGRLKAAAQRHRHRFNCSSRASSCSWLRIYSRITSSSRPTVETKYPRAQKC